MYPCKQVEKSVDHILYHCILHKQDRNKLNAMVKRPDSWPMSKVKHGIKYYKNVKEFTDNILLNIER